MKTTWVRYAGIAAAVLVPAWVVAQTVSDLPLTTNLEAGDVLRAQDVQAMRNAMATLIGRVAELERRPQLSNVGTLPIAAGAGPRNVESSPCPQPTTAIGCAACESDSLSTTLVRFVANTGTNACRCTFLNTGTTTSNPTAIALCR